MRALLLGAVVVAALVLSGCGQSGPSKAGRRRAVSQYIDSVDIQERVMAQQLRGVTNAYHAFSGNAAKLRRAAPSFAHAETTLRTLRTRLARVPAPADARPLRRRLLALVDGEIGLAHEVAALALYLPRFEAVLAPLNRARATLKASLAQATVPKPTSVPQAKLKAAQAAYAAAVAAAAGRRADALAAYLDSVGRVASALRALHPPPVMAPTRATELRTLSGIRAAGAKLVAALRTQRYAAVPTLSRAFQAAALTGMSLESQRAEIAAVKAFDQRVRATGTLALRVQKERARVQKLLG